MSTNAIAIAVVSIGLLVVAAALIWQAQRMRKHQRHNKAESIRGQAAQESLRVGQHEALADETAAKARAAQAQADVKAAQASGLQQQAAAHRHEATNSRDHLNQQWDQAEKLDPVTLQKDETLSPVHKEAQNL